MGKSAAAPSLQQQPMLSLPVKRRHSSVPPGVDSRKSAFVKQSSSPSSDDDAPLVALPSQPPPAASAAATFPAAAADHATAAECCDCDESETSGFGLGDEAEDLDIDDGLSMQDVQATAMVRPPPHPLPFSMPDSSIGSTFCRRCSRSTCRMTCPCASVRWSSSAHSSPAPCGALSPAASTSAARPAPAKLPASTSPPGCSRNQPTAKSRQVSCTACQRQTLECSCPLFSASTPQPTPPATTRCLPLFIPFIFVTFCPVPCA